MALTLTKQFKEPLGGGFLTSWDITFDGSTSGFVATSVELNYIKSIVNWSPRLSGVATTSLIVGNMGLSIGAEGQSINWVKDPLPSDGDRGTVLLYGW